MWIEKLTTGVIRVVTPIGPRFLGLSFWQRAYFLWIFRNFDTLPQQVLSEGQRRMIDQLFLEKRFVSLPSGGDDSPVIGTLERIPVVKVDGDIRSNDVGQPSGIPLPADGQNRS